MIGNPECGFDPAQFLAALRRGWRKALRCPVLARLLPPEPVRVRYPSGDLSVWPSGACPRAVQAEVFILPEGLLLRHTLSMPSLAAAARREAVELAVSVISPFPLEKTVWGWRATSAGSGLEIELVMASRDRVSDYLRETGQEYLNEIEIWAPGVVEEAPIVLQGYGERRRLMRMYRFCWRIARFMVFTALLLMLGLAVLPVILIWRAQ
jgi:hypothetical protein